MARNEKPLGRKGYGHIPHLPESKTGSGDHRVNEGQAKICTEKVRDKFDEVIVQEKLDGSNVCVANIDDIIVPVTRAGYNALNSYYLQHHLFANWVYERTELFSFLKPNERVVGEWLAQAHGTRYDLSHGPFVAFDIMTNADRINFDLFNSKVEGLLPTPRLIHRGGAISVEEVISMLEPSGHGALDPVEGAVWRVERKGKVIFLAKYVRPDKIVGRYLERVTHGEPVWNWYPDQEKS